MLNLFVVFNTMLKSKLYPSRYLKQLLVSISCFSGKIGCSGCLLFSQDRIGFSSFKRICIPGFAMYFATQNICAGLIKMLYGGGIGSVRLFACSFSTVLIVHDVSTQLIFFSFYTIGFFSRSMVLSLASLWCLWKTCTRVLQSMSVFFLPGSCGRKYHCASATRKEASHECVQVSIKKLQTGNKQFWQNYELAASDGKSKSYLIAGMPYFYCMHC